MMRDKRCFAIHAHLCLSNQHVDNGGIQKEDAEWPVDVAGSAKYEIFFQIILDEKKDDA